MLARPSAFLAPLVAASVAASAAALAGCAHGPSVERPSVERVERRLLVLETEFAEFTAVSLDRSDEGDGLSPEESMARVEQQTAALEGLRMRYLDLVQDGVEHRHRLVAMVRIAELHLDLASRIRRLPYAPDSTAAEKKQWDERLSRLALPLEAVGLGVLEQVVEYAEHRQLDGRFIRRAHVYLALHRRGSLQSEEVAALRVELTQRGPYGAPRRLLEAGRVGQRAARR